MQNQNQVFARRSKSNVHINNNNNEQQQSKPTQEERKT